MQCERCQQLLIEIERYGDYLIGCIECNCWQSNKSALSWISRLEIFGLSETVGKHLTFDNEAWQVMKHCTS